MSDSPAAPAGAFPVPGLRPPTERTGAKRRIGDVIVQLGFAERELVEKARSDERAGSGMPLGQALIDAGDRRLEPARPGARRAQRARLRRPQRVRGRPRRRPPARPGQGAPLPDRSRSPSSASRRCWWRRPTRPTCSPSTTSRWPPATRCAARSPRPRTSSALIGQLSQLGDVGRRSSTRGGGRRRGHRAARPGRRGAGRQAGALRDRRRGAPRRLRHPLRAARGRHARALPHRRRGARLHHRAAPARAPAWSRA